MKLPLLPLSRSLFLPLSAFVVVACHDAAPTPIAPSPTAMPPATATPTAATESSPPIVRLPADVAPVAESIKLRIFPEEDRYSGSVDIDVVLKQPRDVVWLHGRDLHATKVEISDANKHVIAATWEQKHESGVVAITASERLGAGRASIHVDFDAPFAKSLKGLYKAKQSGKSYAFTQFEAIAARQAFPCFDEPAFKIPFTLTLEVPPDAVAVANNAESPSPTPNGTASASKTITFKTTPPLPSYLVAFAVGPLDVVEVAPVPPNATRKRPLPLRGIAAKGRGPEMKYALAHTGEIVAVLEGYFGIEYPYDKLDILAVPDKGGAMENPGAITFREYLVLMDEKTAPVSQKRAFGNVMAHELAHMWFGDLVTMQWWDDTWLNEAFATWMGHKATDLWDPKMHAELGLLGGVQGAMGVDALVSARSIRQPVTTTHDIENAFDSITYQKGGGVLAMFERWMGADVFQKGVRAYLEAHRNGNAGADDFLAAESAASGKDVKTPFHTFLDQPGVPFIEASLTCDRAGAVKSAKSATMRFTQSRYLPTGSNGDPNRTWQIPICTRYGDDIKGTKEACTLLTEKEGTLALPTTGGDCPRWVLPNANGAGYFRFALAPADLARLRKDGMSELSTREKIAYANGLRAAFNRGATPMKDIIVASSPLASDPYPDVAVEPSNMLGVAHDWLFADPLRTKVEAYARTLYRPAYDKLGWVATKGEDDDRALLRQRVVQVMTSLARDPAARAEAKRRAHAYIGFGKNGDGKIHVDAVDANLAGIALSVAGEEADAAFFDALVAQLGKTEDDALRGRLLWAIGSPKNADLAARARELAIDPRLRGTEVAATLDEQLGANETREVAWQWMKEHYDTLIARMPSHHGGVRLVGMAQVFCDEAHAQDVEAFFAKKIDSIEGGPRVLASTLENIRLCAAKRKVQEPSARELFKSR